MNIDLSSLKLEEKFKCKNGSIVKNLACVQCPRGTFQKKNSCISCPFGFYQNQPGQIECIKCADFYSTRKSNSKFSSDCKKTCPPGTISRIKIPKSKKVNEKLKTLMPFCKSCMIGEYNSLHDQLECQKCSIGFTSPRASTSLKDCTPIYEKPVCSPSPCGDYGKCVESGQFYYCNCEPGFVGKNCEYKLDICLTDPCQNGGICQYLNGSLAVCVCPINYSGPNCELYKDPCQGIICANGGVCEEIAGQALCECLPAFGGERCETKLSDYCQNNPCVTGTCVSDSNGYNCICPLGTIGRRCHLTPCDYSPCPENAICLNLLTNPTTKDSFSCSCIKGYKGKNCDEIDSPCDNNPCKNNAKCIPKLLRNMTLPGDYYEDELFEQFECECPHFFYGERCEIFTTPDFVMEFAKSSINNYVKMAGPFEDFHELSFCAWIQTKDTFNYGSLLSYATPATDNSFTFTDYNGFVLYINGENRMTDIKIIDDIWHFICVSWSSNEGLFEIFLDGELNTEGYNLSAGNPVPGNGVFIIGQEQDILNGGFSETESFVGKIAYMDFWSKTLTSAEINEFYRTCEPYQGNLFSWTDMKFNLHGNLIISKSDFCRPCPRNLTLTNGNVMYSENEAYFNCQKGYNLIGNPKIYCLRTSQWERALPFCKLIRCGAPSIQANGRAIISKTSYGGLAKFFCDDGFLLIGSDEATCTLNGTWSAETPLCKSIIQCEPLKPPSNGYLIYATDFGRIMEELQSYQIGTFVELKCNPGFRSESENLLTCLDNGSWDSKIEECILIATESPILVDIEFYRNFKNFLFYGCSPKNSEKASKLCNRYLSSISDLTGFVLPESDESHKMDVKLLDLLEKTIETENLREITVENFLNRLLYGSENRKKMSDVSEKIYRFAIQLYIELILVDESLGLRSKEDNINNKIKTNLRKILQEVQRNDEEESLKDEISESLGLLRPKPMNAIQALIHSKYGDSEEPEIIEIERLQEPETTTEIEIPQLSCIVSEVELKESQQIHELFDKNKNALTLGQNVVEIGSSISIRCAKNYRMLKNMTSICQEDGKWSEFENNCELITCPTPQDYSAQGKSKKLYTIGDKIRINCKEGYVVLGSPFIYCTAEGKWTKINAKCTRRSCNKPKLPEKAIIVAGNSFLYRDKVTIMCYPSEVIDVECKSNGNWHPNPENLCIT